MSPHRCIPRSTPTDLGWTTMTCICHGYARIEHTFVQYCFRRWSTAIRELLDTDAGKDRRIFQGGVACLAKVSDCRVGSRLSLSSCHVKGLVATDRKRCAPMAPPMKQRVAAAASEFMAQSIGCPPDLIRGGIHPDDPRRGRSDIAIAVRQFGLKEK